MSDNNDNEIPDSDDENYQDDEGLQMKEEEDEEEDDLLCGGSSSQCESVPPADKHPAEDDMEEAPPSKQSGRLVVKETIEMPTKADDNEEDEEDDNENPGYVMFNGAAYYVPISDGTKAGRVRDYNYPMQVENGEALTALKNSSGWPQVEMIPPKAIVVIKGRHTSDEKLSSNEKDGPFTWYVRFCVKSNPDGDDSNILRPVPKTIVKSFLSHIEKNDGLSRSSLVRIYHPENGNAKLFPVAPNGWVKAPKLKSDAVPAIRVSKKNRETDDVVEEDVRKPSKPPKPSKLPAPVVPKKMGEKKQTSLEFPSTGSGKATVHKSVENQVDAPPAIEFTVSSSSKKSTESQKKNITFVDDNSKTGSASKVKTSDPTQTPAFSEASSSKKHAIEYTIGVEDTFKNIKRMRVVECRQKERTHTFWDGNALVVIELRG